jgi:hypothetical protein
MRGPDLGDEDRGDEDDRRGHEELGADVAPDAPQRRAGRASAPGERGDRAPVARGERRDRRSAPAVTATEIVPIWAPRASAYGRATTWTIAMAPRQAMAAVRSAASRAVMGSRIDIASAQPTSSSGRIIELSSCSRMWQWKT